jgi:hypothetical protein
VLVYFIDALEIFPGQRLRGEFSRGHSFLRVGDTQFVKFESLWCGWGGSRMNIVVCQRAHTCERNTADQTTPNKFSAVHQWTSVRDGKQRGHF